MQRSGSFSVDREGSDRKAMSTAIEVVKETGALTILPEGNVYFTNDRRAKVKKDINLLLGSAIVEEKSYADHGGPQ